MAARSHFWALTARSLGRQVLASTFGRQEITKIKEMGSRVADVYTNNKSNLYVPIAILKHLCAAGGLPGHRGLSMG